MFVVSSISIFMSLSLCLLTLFQKQFAKTCPFFLLYPSHRPPYLSNHMNLPFVFVFAFCFVPSHWPGRWCNLNRLIIVDVEINMSIRYSILRFIYSWAFWTAINMLFGCFALFLFLVIFHKIPKVKKLERLLVFFWYTFRAFFKITSSLSPRFHWRCMLLYKSLDNMTSLFVFPNVLKTGLNRLVEPVGPETGEWSGSTSTDFMFISGIEWTCRFYKNLVEPVN